MPIRPDRPRSAVVRSLALAVAAFAAASIPLRAEEPAKPADRFAGRLAPCTVEELSGSAYCGDLEVWENRATKSGRKIPIHVVVLPARESGGAPDPVVFFDGGPGVAGTPAASEIGWLLDALRRDRDLVFFDQRGTGKSNGFFCPTTLVEGDIQGLVTTMFPIEPLRRCRPELERRADMSQYTTIAAMDDLDEVRAWLGYERWNLLGISYGTIAARVYARQHPTRVRSMVLMGVAPIDTPSPLEYAREAQTALDRVVDDCGADYACRTAFPDPKGDLAKAFAALERAPAPVSFVETEGEPPVSFSLTRDWAAATVRNLLYSADTYVKIPALLHAAAAGDFVPLGRRALRYGRNLAEDGMGSYLTYMCPESTALVDRTQIPAWTAGTFLGDSRVRTQLAGCDLWPKIPVPAEFFAPVVSPAPALLVSGWIDPVTPPEIAVEVAKTLPNSLHLVLRDGAHGSFGLMGGDCVWKLIDDFFVDGSPYRLDPAACLASARRPPFEIELGAR